ncbi:MAG: 23S rRNA (adenine(2503)-C(2))-methyltransferase RlmN [Deferribacteraceae bacterium]|jgi:23S rRNA (adenine2503-C2)-methyltransferase|nr:23S rRNA (adenine(2503)-C(2))-methyltransferase RlmN [Deferribacteraceae bacterium]
MSKTPSKLSINSCSLSELDALISAAGEKPYRAQQLYRWLYFDRVETFNEMSNIPVKLLNFLSEMAEITRLEEADRQESASGASGSIKFVFRLMDGVRIESVLLSDRGKLTACISTQAGCRMGCKFCATATLGLKRNLLTAEMLEQVKLLERAAGKKLDNLVFMGMGEPLDNTENLIKALQILLECYGYSHRKITVSTVGLIPNLQKLFSVETPVNLAVSINAPRQDLRRELMPISAKHPLDELLAALKALPLQKRKRITLEYVLLGGVNDQEKDARELLKIIKDLPVKINLIRFNTWAGAEYKRPIEKDVLAFQKALTDRGFTAFIRRSLGGGINGACGQLALRETL